MKSWLLDNAGKSKYGGRGVGFEPVELLMLSGAERESDKSWHDNITSLTLATKKKHLKRPYEQFTTWVKAAIAEDGGCIY